MPLLPHVQSSVKYDLLKSRPAAFIPSTSTENLEEIVRTISKQWNLRNSSLFLNLISDKTVFSDFNTNVLRQKSELLKLGFKKLLETDVRPVLFTSGRIDDPITTLVGRAALETCENAAYVKEISVDGDEETQIFGKSTNFKLIAVNSVKLIDESCSQLEPNHTHLILIENINATETDIINFRTELIKFLSNDMSTKEDDEDTEQNERYVSVPVSNHFYEIPNSRLPWSLDATFFVPSVFFYFGRSEDDISWILKALNENIPIIVFENVSPFANFLASVRNCSKFPKIAVEKIIEKKCRQLLSSEDLQLDLQNLIRLCQTINNNTKENNNILLVNFLTDKNLDKIPYLVSLVLKNCVEICEPPTKIFRLMMQLNVSCLLTDVKFEPSFVNSFHFYQFFEEALTDPSKECFVKWFLDCTGLKVSQFLTLDRFVKLFKNTVPREFFNNVVLANLLGYVSFPNDVLKFIKVDLKRLFYNLTSKTMKLKDISFDLDEIRLTLNNDSYLLEKRFFDVLVFWAALMKRSSLVKLLWSYSYDPLPLALVLTEIFKNLEQNSSEFFIYVDDLRDLSRNFKEYSVQLLTEADIRAPRRSYDVLCYGFEQYSHVTATHLAYVSENRRFIAHTWCQRWLNRLLYGNMKICKIKSGFFTLHNWCKILLCALFVLPIKFWIKYPSSFNGEEKLQKDSIAAVVNAVSNRTNDEIIHRNNVRFNSLTEEVMARVGIIDEQRESAATDSQETDNFLQNNGAPNILPEQQLPVASSSETTEDCCVNGRQRKLISKEAGFCFTVYHFYDAPIAKYWLHLAFRLMYLILFGVSLSFPKCGYVILDLIIWFWSFVDWMECLWIIYLKHKNRLSGRSKYDVLDVFVVGTFLFLFMLLKIVSNITYFSSSAFTGRIVAAFFLLYRCYATLFTYLPMHSTLGPLLIRIRLMVCRDFVNFLILAALIIASFAVVIHATIYPDFSFGSELWLRAFKRAWFTLFTTPIDDLNEDSRCRSLYLKNSPYCTTGSYLDPSCPKVSAASYFVVIQYLIVIKLIAWPLLFALFGKTAKEIDEEADFIWKYQFYCMVTDFSLKPVLPPPFTPFSFLILLFSRCRRCGVNYFQSGLEPASDHPDVGLVRFGSVIDHGKRRQNANYYSFWRSLARNFYDKRTTAVNVVDETVAQLHDEIIGLKQELVRISEVLELQS